MLYNFFCFYLSAGKIAVPAMVRTMTSTWATTQIIALYDIFRPLFPTAETDHRMGCAPNAYSSQTYEAG